MEGRLLRALTDAVLALYGEPEPDPSTPVSEIVDWLHALAADRRSP